MSAKEIERLRRKFVRVSMMAIAVAMLFIGTLVNVVYYAYNRIEVDWSLNALLTNENVESITYQDWSDMPNIIQVFTPSFQRTGYYVAAFSEEGEMTAFFSNHLSPEADDDAQSAAQAANTKRARRGRLGLFYYKRKALEDGGTIVALVDSSVTVMTNVRLLYYSGGVAALGLIITYILVRAFSHKAIQPEIENTRRQERFITNASHELKTPLAVIRANTEMTELMDGESEWTQSTLRQVDRLSGFIQNLVMVTRARERADSGEAQECDLTKAVTETVDTFEAVAMQEGKALAKALEDSVRLVIDEGDVRQLASLLVDNAIKYCDDGGRIEVALRPIRRGRGVELTVSNDYKEGEEQDVDRFFDRFYREDGSHNIDKGGYGIGLSIAQGICEKHLGSIRAAWKDGRIAFVCQVFGGK